MNIILTVTMQDVFEAIKLLESEKGHVTNTDIFRFFYVGKLKHRYSRSKEYSYLKSKTDVLLYKQAIKRAIINGKAKGYQVINPSFEHHDPRGKIQNNLVKVARLFFGGLSSIAIAQEAGISRAQVYQNLKKLGVTGAVDRLPKEKRAGFPKIVDLLHLGPPASDDINLQAASRRRCLCLRNQPLPPGIRNPHCIKEVKSWLI